MTRINVGVCVKELTDEHLLAEHREIKRLPSCLDRSIQSGSIKFIPPSFILGQGHVLFFLDKLKYSYSRYLNIREECLRRGFNVQDFSANWDRYKDTAYFSDYIPKEQDRDLVVSRIKERIGGSTKKMWHYCGKAITGEEAMNLLRTK